jgi:hypothetical protein
MGLNVLLELKRIHFALTIVENYKEEIQNCCFTPQWGKFIVQKYYLNIKVAILGGLWYIYCCCVFC